MLTEVAYDGGDLVAKLRPCGHVLDREERLPVALPRHGPGELARWLAADHAREEEDGCTREAWTEELEHAARGGARQDQRHDLRPRSA